MTHLIKLELKKFGIAQNIIFMFAAILFSILFITKWIFCIIREENAYEVPH